MREESKKIKKKGKARDVVGALYIQELLERKRKQREKLIMGTFPANMLSSLL